MKKILLTAIIMSLAACSDEKVSFEAVDIQRAVANDNSRFNAKKWRADNGFGHLDILARGDSTQQVNCPQGDGWASVDLIDPETKKLVQPLKCSTVSSNIGCLKAQDFKARSVLDSQENTCNRDIPKVLKKITE